MFYQVCEVEEIKPFHGLAVDYVPVLKLWEHKMLLYHFHK